MKVLLTGGAGYIGAHVELELLRAGHDIVVADNFSNSDRRALAQVEKLTGRTFPVYEIDVCERDGMNRMFEAEKIDAVIHLAGLKAVGESVEMPLAYYKNNLNATITLAEMMERHNVKRLVFSSSATVYGLAGNEMPLREDAPLGCASPYGWTKFMNEQILKDCAAAHPDWSVVLLRYFNPVGADVSGLIGEKPNGIPNNLVPRIMQSLTGHLGRFAVYGDDYPTPDGTCVRDYIHITDLAKGHMKALLYAEKHAGCEAINLGTGVGYSVMEVIKTFEEVNGVKLDYEVTERRPGDLPVSYASCDKAARLLNWKAEKALSDMCRDAWRWHMHSVKEM